MRLIASILLIGLSVSGRCEGSIRLELLSNCDGLSAAQTSLQISDYRCRPPQNTLERIFNSRLREHKVDDFCFARLNVPMLTDFNCLVANTPAGYSQLLCVRLGAAKDLSEYQAQHQSKYAPLVNQYLKRARTCRAGNGDSSRGNPVLMPPLLTWVARWRFGFVLPIGDPLVGKNLFLHGFADLDPEIETDRSLEFFMTDMRR